MRRTIRALLPALALATLLWLHPFPARADTSAAEAGVGIAAGLCSLVYAPVKIVYALGGGMVGGLAWLLSGGDSAVSEPIFTASMRGNYVVTPANLKGTEDLEFIGRRPTDRQLRETAGATNW
jgi:hypothetical protein